MNFGELEDVLGIDEKIKIENKESEYEEMFKNEIIKVLLSNHDLASINNKKLTNAVTDAIRIYPDDLYTPTQIAQYMVSSFDVNTWQKRKVTDKVKECKWNQQEELKLSEMKNWSPIVEDWEELCKMYPTIYRKRSKAAILKKYHRLLKKKSSKE